MKKAPEECVARAIELRQQGWSMQSIADELEVSKAAVVKWITEKGPGAATPGMKSGDDETFSQDYLTINPLTRKEKEYIKEYDVKKLLYQDTAEGWMLHMTDAELRAAGSISWFVAIVYPESAPDGWKDRLTETGLQWGCSPLHDKDPWTHDSPAGLGLKDGKQYMYTAGELYKAGDKKKPHWHIIGKLDRPWKYRRFAIWLRDITHGTYPQPCMSLVRATEYLTHINEDPERKYPYWAHGDKPEFYNGFTPEMNTNERKKAQAQIINVIREEKIDTIGKLTEKYKDSPEYLDIISARSGIMQMCVHQVYYSLHPEDTSKYSRELQAEQVREIRELKRALWANITGEVISDVKDN